MKTKIENGAKFYLGATVYDAVLPVVDLSLSDPALFEACLHDMAVQWSSTGGTPHCKEHMRDRGRVARYSEGRYVYVSGNGWSCAYYSPEYVEEMTAAIAVQDVKKMVDMVSDAMVWHYEKPVTPVRPRRWRK